MAFEFEDVSPNIQMPTSTNSFDHFLVKVNFDKMIK